MADSQLRMLIGALKAALEGVKGAPYSVDLTDRVHVGTAIIIPDQVPQVWLTVESATSPGRADLCTWSRVAVIGVVGFVAGTEDSGESRLYAAADLLSDIASAIEERPGLGLQSYLHGIDVTVSGRSLDGHEIGEPQLGVVGALVTVTWITTGGY